MPRHCNTQKWYSGQRKCRKKVDPLLTLIYAFLDMYLLGGDQTLTLKTDSGKFRDDAAKKWWNFHRSLAGQRNFSVPCYSCGTELKAPHKARKGEDTGQIGHIVPRDSVLRLAKKGDPVAYAHGETLMNLVPTCRTCEEITGKGILTLSCEGRRIMNQICKKGKSMTTSVHKERLFCTFD
jgi:hypothetical protein